LAKEVGLKKWKEGFMADITINQLVTQEFYQIPKIFMSRTERKRDKKGNVIQKIKYTSKYTKLLTDSKFAYGILYNRCQLSIRSSQQGKFDYVDENGAIFLIFTVEELMELLDKSKGTIIKIKKNLAEFGLLREVRQGINKPNKLYLQLVEASYQMQEYYDENDNLIKRIDYQGNELPISIPTTQNTYPQGQLHDTCGSSNFGLPKNELQEVQNLNPSKNELSENKRLDTDRYISPSSKVSDSDIFKFGDFPFLTEKTIQLLSCFGLQVGKKLANKIYEAKRKVETNYSDTFKQRYQCDNESFVAGHFAHLNGNIWQNDLEHELEKLVFKYKTAIAEDKPIRDLPAYFYSMMLNFWQRAFVIEMNLDYLMLEEQKQDFESIMKYHFPEALSKQKLKKRLDYVVAGVKAGDVPYRVKKFDFEIPFV
jgi:hypothetical protein